MPNQLIGEIRLFAGFAAPSGWAFCDGQLAQINQNQSLFSVLGTRYGGDGVTTFALPDLRGRVPIHAGTGPGLSTRSIGDKGGAEEATVALSEMPAHSHRLQGSTDTATTNQPGGKVMADAALNLYHQATPSILMSADAVTEVGGGQPHDNVMPYGTVNYIIALTGLFP